MNWQRKATRKWWALPKYPTSMSSKDSWRSSIRFSPSYIRHQLFRNLQKRTKKMSQSLKLVLSKKLWKLLLTTSDLKSSWSRCALWLSSKQHPTQRRTPLPLSYGNWLLRRWTGNSLIWALKMKRWKNWMRLTSQKCRGKKFHRMTCAPSSWQLCVSMMENISFQLMSPPCPSLREKSASVDSRKRGFTSGWRSCLRSIKISTCFTRTGSTFKQFVASSRNNYNSKSRHRSSLRLLDQTFPQKLKTLLQSTAPNTSKRALWLPLKTARKRRTSS